ncbi:MAG: hypothetical protein HZA81_02245 [Candidatus Taylorbacteria bacterium]|nr:hypothetical protein [Candidatus Taylorbacteria bacterium]
MKLFRLFGKKEELGPEEELRQVEFKLRHSYNVDRAKLETRKIELEKLLLKKPN